MKELRPGIVNPKLCVDCPVKDLYCRGMRKKIVYANPMVQGGPESVFCDEIIPEEDINRSVIIVVGNCEPLPVDKFTPPREFEPEERTAMANIDFA